MTRDLPAHERFRRSYFRVPAERKPYVRRRDPYNWVPRTPEEQADYERRCALTEGCQHELFLSGNRECMICSRCWGFRRATDAERFPLTHPEGRR